jgi:hypothetical protein
MTDFLNLWNLMRLPMQRWWELQGRWLCLPLALLAAAAALKFMVQPNMPLGSWLLATGYVGLPLLKSMERVLSIPIMLLLFAFVGLWVSAAMACQGQMRSLLEESAAPVFDASPLQRLLVCYGQGLILLPLALIVYTGIGYLSALAERMQMGSTLQSVVQFTSPFAGNASIALLPEHYTHLLEAISQYSASAFAVAALSLWITAIGIAGGAWAGYGFLALRSLDVGILSAALLFGGTLPFNSARPLVRVSLPLGEFFWCVPALLLLIFMLAQPSRWLRRPAQWLLAVFALSPAFFASVLPRSMFLEDTPFARLINSLHYMYYGISGPAFQVKASVLSDGNALHFREHLLLLTDRSTLLFNCSGTGIMLAWLGNTLVLALLCLLVMGLVRWGVPQQGLHGR